MAHRLLPPGVAGRAPRRGRLRAGTCRWLLPKLSIPMVFQWLDVEREQIALPPDCPHIGAGAGRLSACSVRLPFAGEDRSDASGDCPFRAVSVAPGASLALRLKAPPSKKTRSVCLRAQGEPLDRRSAAAPSLSGERRTGANGRTVAYPTRSCGAQMSSKERRCSNETISTGSPVGLQACYKGSLASPPANSLQFEGKSAKVWLMCGRGKRRAFWGGGGCGSICNIRLAEPGAGSRGRCSGSLLAVGPVYRCGATPGRIRGACIARARRSKPSAPSSRAMRHRPKFLLGLSAGVRAEIFTLANPYRVVVDLPDVAFHLPDGTGQKGQRARFRLPLRSAGRRQGARRHRYDGAGRHQARRHERPRAAVPLSW